MKAAADTPPTTEARRATPGADAIVVDGLRVESPGGQAIVTDVSLTLRAGEILGLVGESGSGKTTTALAMLGYTHAGARLAAGQVSIGGTALPIDDEGAMRKLRGSLVSYVPQNPGTALNPSMRVGDAIGEMARAHKGGSAPEKTIAEALERVGLPGGLEFQRRYPHQLSGGQQQRICISVALACEPPVVVLDEPTTGLDVITQAKILKELEALCQEHGLAMLYVTHDLAVVAQIADRIAVMYGGRLVEEGSARQVLRAPRHPYTKGLLASIPDHVKPAALEPLPGVAVSVGEWPTGCAFAPRCALRTEDCEAAVPELRAVADGQAARCIHAEQVTAPKRAQPEVRVLEEARQEPVLAVAGLRAEHRSGRETVIAAADVSFDIHKGHCVALVGESGSGKTTIARAVAGLHPIADGSISLDGQPLSALARKRSPEQRRRVQIIFQNPADALNPRHTVRNAIGRPARMFRGLAGKEAETEVARLLELVRMPARLADRYPMELSGGERQRVGIARALAAQPDVVICDEVTSALDVSVQAAVLDLLDELRRELGLGLLFITHDLGVVATIADSVLVLEAGSICESGPTHQVLTSPQRGYTKRLLEAAPSVAGALEWWERAESDATIAGR